MILFCAVAVVQLLENHRGNATVVIDFAEVRLLKLAGGKV